MGLGHNPLINGLIQHTFKFNFLFEKKNQCNTFWLDKTFSCWPQVTMMLKKKIFWKQKKLEWDFQLGIPLPSQLSKKKQLMKNHWGYTLAEVRPQPLNGCIKFLIFLNSRSGPQVYRGADRRRKSPLDGATDFLATIWQHIQQSVLCKLSFWFWPGSPKMSELGLNLIQFISNLYVGVFL